MSDGSRGGEELWTARLSLRRPIATDVDAIFEIHSDPGACLHNPSDRLNQRGDAEELYRRWNEQWRRYGYGYWVVRRRGSDMQLGFCGIKPMELGGMKILNLFYRFTPSAWGQGVGGESAAAVVAWASREVPDLPLIARVRPANVASQRVAIRAGLTRAERLDTPGDDGVDWIFAANLHAQSQLRLPAPGKSRLRVFHRLDYQVRDAWLQWMTCSRRRGDAARPYICLLIMGDARRRPGIITAARHDALPRRLGPLPASQGRGPRSGGARTPPS